MPTATLISDVDAFNMGDSHPTPSCLSAEPHEARDSLLHYLGCAEFCERQAFFDSLKLEDRKRINGEIRRIVRLRRALKTERDDSVSSLVRNMEGSMEAWRESRGNHGIDAVRKWRTGKGLPNDATQDFPHEGEAPGSYDADSDVKAYLIRYKDGKHAENAQDHGAKGHYHTHKMLELQRKILVSRLLMQPAPANTSKTSDRLLFELSQPSDGGINYLHLPANNMAVSTNTLLPKYSINKWGNRCCSCL